MVSIHNINNGQLLLCSTFIFLLCPLFSLPILCLLSIRGIRLAQLELAITLGVISKIVILPTGDLFRHFQIFNTIEDYSFSQLSLWLAQSIRLDFLLYWYEWILHQLHIPFGFVRFTFIIISYCLFFDLYNKFIKLYKSKRIIVFFIFLLSVPFSSISIGLRFGFAETIIAYIIIKRFYIGDKSKLDFIYLCLALCIHFGTIVFILCLIISKFSPNNINQRSVLVLFIISSFLLGGALYILNNLPLGANLKEWIEAYTVGGASDDKYLSSLNFFGRLNGYLFYIITIVLIYFLFHKIPYDKTTKIDYIICFLWALTASLYSLNMRIGSMLSILIPIFGIKIINRKLLLSLYLLPIFISFLLGWKGYALIKWENLFLPVSYGISSEYDRNWVSLNIDNYGNPLIYMQ